MWETKVQYLDQLKGHFNVPSALQTLLKPYQLNSSAFFPCGSTD